MGSLAFRSVPRVLARASLQPRGLRPLTTTQVLSQQKIATFDIPLIDKLPPQTHTLFEAKARKGLTFADIGKAIGRDETAVAAVFYGHHQVSPEDITGLSQALDIPESTLHEQIPSYPYRGHVMEMPPKEPLIYRLYEVIQNYGYAYKAIMNEKFGDGIMSAVTFSTKVEKETDEKGDWVKITMRGKWLPYSRF